MKKKLWIVLAAGLILAGMAGAANATLLISKSDKLKLELFAREKTEGWDVWGNEVESDIIL